MSRPNERAASSTTSTSKARGDCATTSRSEAVTATRANVIGTGLIGGSIGLALRRRGVHVAGSDADEARARRALDLGVLNEIGLDPSADLTFVAVPVGAIPDEVARALDSTSGLVTDVGSVKASITDSVDSPRFVGGHPMAGSE